MKNLTGLEPTDYLRILWRRRFYALTGFVLVIAGTAVYSWRTPDVFRSVCNIQVEPAVVPRNVARPSVGSTPAQQIAAIRQLIQTRSFAETMIREFQLFGYGSNGTFSFESAIQQLANNVTVSRTSGDTFRLSTVSTDPQMAQAMTKRVAEMLIQSSSSVRKNRALEADQFVDDLLRQAEQKLLAHEEKIKQFTLDHLGLMPGQNSSNIDTLNQLNRQLADVDNSLEQLKERQKRLELRQQQQKRFNQVTNSILNQPSQPSSPEVPIQGADASNPLLEKKMAELKALSLKYTPNFPDVVRLTKEVEQLKLQAQTNAPSTPNPPKEDNAMSPEAPGEDLPGANIFAEIEATESRVEAESIKEEFTKLEARRDSILSQIEDYRRRIKLAPDVELQYRALARENDFLRRQYTNLQNKKSQAELTTSLETSQDTDQYTIIDEANLPEKPVFPDRRQIVLLGLVAGIAIGLGAAFGREVLDSTLANEQEVASVLKLPVLVTVSEIPGKTPKRLMGSRIRKSA